MISNLAILLSVQLRLQHLTLWKGKHSWFILLCATIHGNQQWPCPGPARCRYPYPTFAIKKNQKDHLQVFRLLEFKLCLGPSHCLRVRVRSSVSMLQAD